jgi:hypothetical protein
MVDQILVAERDPAEALHEHGLDRVLDQLRRAAVGEAPKRRTSPIARSAAPGSSAPASEITCPPSKAATTWRPSTAS